MPIQKTFVILKPDAVQRGIVDVCIERFIKAGLKLREKYKIRLNKEFVDNLYKHLENKISKRLLENIKKWMLSDFVVVVIFEGEDAVKRAREICGNTNPAEAKKGTIRGDFSSEDIRENIKYDRETHNIVHASATIEEARKEINLFKKIILKE